MKKPKNQQDFDENYDEVYELVQQGLTIQKALSRLKIDSREFYSNMSREQSSELSIAKINQFAQTGHNIRLASSKSKYNY